MALTPRLRTSRQHAVENWCLWLKHAVFYLRIYHTHREAIVLLHIGHHRNAIASPKKILLNCSWHLARHSLPFRDIQCPPHLNSSARSTSIILLYTLLLEHLPVLPTAPNSHVHHHGHHIIFEHTWHHATTRITTTTTYYLYNSACRAGCGCFYDVITKTPKPF